MNMTTNRRRIYIDPSYSAYYQDRLFDPSDKVLNRDGTLLPFVRLKASLESQGRAEVHTADYLLNAQVDSEIKEYWSLGLLDNYPKLLGRMDVRLKGFLIMEPPVVAPRLYKALPELTKHFDHVYVHNTVGDGYSLKNVDQSRLKKFHWPQPNADVIEPYWSNEDRQNRIVVINGNHLPRSFRAQLYGKRIKVMAELAKSDKVDLYGRGWNQWWSHRSMWPPYWRHYRTLMSIYKGTCESKYEVLSRYNFSLCFENMSMDGYVTEKIFDCLYAGTIPIYMGAKDIENYLPQRTYIDFLKFCTVKALEEFLAGLSIGEITDMRQAGKEFMKTENYKNYYKSLLNIVND